jgi:folate-dependent phosphoribosylglycinamide formyltransferase PurN
MNRIALITSDSRRHRWLAAQLSKAGQLVCVLAERKPPQNQGNSSSEAAEMRSYFEARADREAYWFREAPECFSQVALQAHELPWQGSNTPEMHEVLLKSRVDQVFLFGSSIIRDPILSHFSGRIVNMHLGLSPYYRGSATNYWPLVDGLPECVGVTVHHATPVVDGGGILAQARPEMHVHDSVHDIGCKTMIAGAALLNYFASQPGPLPAGMPQSGTGKLCRRADFDIESLHTLKTHMENGLLGEYLARKPARDTKYPIVKIT